MKVKVIKPFTDIKENVKREKLGEVFEVSQARFKEINSTRHGKLVSKVVEKPKKETEK